MSNIEEYDVIGNTRNMIQRWDAPVAEVKDKDIIVFIGRTQAGKSTIHNLVTGGKLKIAHNIRADPSLANIILDHNEDNDKRAAIGIGFDSETSLPNIYEYLGQTYVDCPGFGDARGFAESVSNGLGIQRVFEAAKSVRLIAVAAEIDYQNRRPSLARHVYWAKRLFIDLADFIVNLDDISKISFIISKASPDITKTDILKSTKSIMDSYIKQKSFLFSYDGTEHMPIDNDYQYARQKKTLELLCSQDINMAFFHKPTNDKLEKEDEDRKSIINLIEKTEKLSSREVHACSLVGKGLNIEYFTSGLITPTQAANLFKGSHISSIGRKNINQIIQAISNKREYMDEIMRCADLDVCRGLLGNHSNITAETQASILPSIQHVDPNYLPEIAKWVIKYRNIEEFCEFLGKKEALSHIRPLLLGDEQKEYLEGWSSKKNIEKLYSTIGKDNFILVLKKLYELEKNPDTHQLYSNRLINWVTRMSDKMIDEVKNSNLQDDMRLCFYMLKHKHVKPNDVEHYDVGCGNKGHFQYKSLINIVNHFRDRDLHYVIQKLDSEYYVPVDLADLNNRTILEIYKYAAKSNGLPFRLEGALYDHEVESCNPNPDMKDVKTFSDEQLKFLAKNIADDELYLLAYCAPVRIMRNGYLSDKQIIYLASNLSNQFYLSNEARSYIKTHANKEQLDKSSLNGFSILGSLNVGRYTSIYGLGEFCSYAYASVYPYILHSVFAINPLFIYIGVAASIIAINSITEKKSLHDNVNIICQSTIIYGSQALLLHAMILPICHAMNLGLLSQGFAIALPMLALYMLCSYAGGRELVDNYIATPISDFVSKFIGNDNEPDAITR